MAKNIEEFLKQAAARKQQQGPGPQQPPQPQQPIIQPPPEPPPRRLEPEVVEIVDDIQVVEPVQSSVGSHVQSHLDTSDIRQHAQQLGSGVEAKSKLQEQRLQNKFDQQVGHLGADAIADRGEVSAETTKAYDSHSSPERASKLAEMFRNPQNIQQAILLKEIIDRPNFDDD